MSRAGRSLLRHQLLAGAGVHAVLALLVLLTTAVAVAAPRAATEAQDAALRHRLAHALQVQRDVTVTGGTQGNYPVPFEPGVAGDVEAAVLDRLGAGADLVADVSFAVSVGPARARTLPAGADPGGELAEVGLRAEAGWTERVTVTAGRLPAPGWAPAAVDPALAHQPTVPVLEVALTPPAAAALDADVGATFLLDPVLSTGVPVPLAVTVVGIVAPADPAADFWAADPLVLEPTRGPTAEGGQKWLVTALLGEDALPALTEAFAAGAAAGPGTGPGGNRAGGDAATGDQAVTSEEGEYQADAPDELPLVVPPQLEHSWRLTLDTPDLTGADTPVLAEAVGRLRTAGALAPFPVRTVTGLPDLLAEHARAVAVTSALVSLCLAAALTMGVLAVVLTTWAAVDRRAADLRLLRARGASLAQLTALAGGPVLVWAVPAAVLGAVAAVAAVPRPGPAAGLAAAALAVGVVLVALAPVPLAARAVTAPAAGQRRPRRRRWGRLTAEATLVLLAAAGTATLRRRGLVDDVAARGAVDPYAALVPTLVVLATAVVVLRAYPPVVRAASRLVGRGRGAVGFLGLARAARARPAAAVPVVVLLLAVAVSTLTGTVRATITTEQDAAAWRAVGADVRVDAPALAAADLAALRALPGVDAVVPAYRQDDATVGTARDADRVTVLAADPAALTALLAGTPLAADLPDLTPRPGGALPAVVSTPDLAPDGGPVPLRTAGRSLTADVVAVEPALARGAGADEPVLLLPYDALAAATAELAPTTALLRGGDAPAVEAVAGPGWEVHGRAQVRGAVADAPLPAFLTVAFAATGVAAAGYSLVAVVLLLALGAADRKAAVARLRAMGLRPGQVRALVAVEAGPPALAALLPGLAVGLALPAVVGPALDLAPFTGGPADPPLVPAGGTAALLGVAVAAVVAVAVLLDAARDARTHAPTDLRRGAR
ncbi:hypothetical protein MF406_01770 [Georgenia sp. TF02-10]|uniref:FtsX-like permease family protein n=1 Tax=Georgenia sp. TF02-10 TaxID=2917725 RepID=UPI001FA79932|nr:FtsX-like permease family protein [Georgenia sp. TF02-10]UNX55039.1 hypothetical protein MF406_01770 [Georgenia sp. TF02-10]